MSDSTSRTIRPSGRVALGLTLWLTAAFALGQSGVLTLERRALIPAVLLGSTGLLMLLARGRGPLGVFWRSIDVRALILLHCVRAPIGAGFLIMAADGRLDPVFATIAGWGDLLVGVTATAALLGGARPSRDWTRVRLVWNAVGLADIAIVVATAQSILLASDHPQSMASLLEVPWILIPLFLVPLVIATHLLLFARFRAASRSADATPSAASASGRAGA